MNFSFLGAANTAPIFAVGVRESLLSSHDARRISGEVDAHRASAQSPTVDPVRSVDAQRATELVRGHRAVEGSEQIAIDAELERLPPRLIPHETFRICLAKQIEGGVDRRVERLASGLDGWLRRCYVEASAFVKSEMPPEPAHSRPWSGLHICSDLDACDGAQRKMTAARTAARAAPSPHEGDCKFSNLRRLSPC